MGKLQLRTFIFIGVIVFLLLLIGVSFASGAFYQKSKGAGEVIEITSQTIIDKITSQSFMVTKTVYIDQSSEIVIDHGSDWSNFFWGQSIDTSALVRADVGVDYATINGEDINIDTSNKLITINIPSAQILDISLEGDIEVESTSGILKMLLQNDPNADHNLAANQLLTDAEQSIVSDTEIMQEAQLDSVEFLKLILGDLGYEVEVVVE